MLVFIYSYIINSDLQCGQNKVCFLEILQADCLDISPHIVHLASDLVLTISPITLVK